MTFIFVPKDRRFAVLVCVLLLFISGTVFGQKGGGTGDKRDTTKTTVQDSTVKKVKRDSLAVIRTGPLYRFSTFVTTTQSRYTTYRNSYDLFEQLPFVFRRNQGFPGQWDELLQFTEGSRYSSVLLNGVYAPGQAAGLPNLNYISDEEFDSLEQVPLTRGFLYGFAGSGSVINAIGNEQVPPVPYTRIRYWEGTYDEAQIEALFRTQIMKRMYAGVSLKNHNSPSSYRRSSSSVWSGTADLSYYWSNNLQFFLRYGFANSLTDLNGGVNVDSLKKLGYNINTYLYDEFAAPIVYEERYQKHKEDRLSGEIRLKSDIGITSLQYQNTSGLQEFRLNEGVSDSGVVVSKYNYKTGSNLIVLRQSIDALFLPAELTLRYGKMTGETNGIALSFKPEQSVAVSVSLLKNPATIHPSVFFKFMSYGGKSYFGAGADLFVNNDNGSSYFGLSYYQREAFLPQSFNAGVLQGELAVTRNYEPFTVNLRLFAKQITDEVFSDVVLFPAGAGFSKYPVFTDISKRTQYGAAGMVKWHRNWLYAEAKISYQRSVTEYYNYNIVPPVTGSADISYRNIHFDSSLVFRGGVVLTASAASGSFGYTYPALGATMKNTSETVPSWFRADVYATGEIKRAAIVFLTIENVLNTGYYITPYFPMRGISFRFGINWQLFN